MTNNRKYFQNIIFNTLIFFRKNISYIGFFFFLVNTVFFISSCEDNNEASNQNLDQDTIATIDSIRFQDLTSLFENRCYSCHSEPEYSFYALNLDSYENTMLGSQNGPVVVPFDPENSLLYTKCSGEHVDGDRMPQDNVNFFDNHPDKLQMIYDWILQGCLE
tara:strand:+ start:433 stop:918 length:486 start_codon:yes stop_codon:yes gene_type:complete